LVLVKALSLVTQKPWHPLGFSGICLYLLYYILFKKKEKDGVEGGGFWGFLKSSKERA